MNTFLIVKQNYLAAEPSFTLYKLESKWFGLKKSYKMFRIDDDFCWTATFNDFNELVGKLIRHYYREDKKWLEIVDRKRNISDIENNTTLIFMEKTPYCGDKPKVYGRCTINEYFNRNK